MELKKDKTFIIKLKSEHAEFRDRVTKVKQRQLHNDNSSNNSLFNFNSVANQINKANSHYEKLLIDKKINISLSKELTLKVIAI